MCARKSLMRQIIAGVAAAMFAAIGTAFAKDVSLNQDNVGTFPRLVCRDAASSRSARA